MALMLAGVNGFGHHCRQTNRVDPEPRLDLADLHRQQRANPVGLRRRQADLVYHLDDPAPVLDGEVGGRQRLRLDALGRVDEQEHTLAGGEGEGRGGHGDELNASNGHPPAP